MSESAVWLGQFLLIKEARTLAGISLAHASSPSLQPSHLGVASDRSSLLTAHGVGGKGFQLEQPAKDDVFGGGNQPGSAPQGHHSPQWIPKKRNGSTPLDDLKAFSPGKASI